MQTKQKTVVTGRLHIQLRPITVVRRTKKREITKVIYPLTMRPSFRIG